MKELITESFALVNLPFTILVIVVVVYWLFVIVGFLGMDSLDMDADVGDMDVEVDADVDMDVDADVDAGVDGDADGDVDAGDSGGGCLFGAFSGMLSFVNAGKMPMAVILSFFIVFMWVGSIIANHYLNPGKSILFALGILIGVYLVSIVLTKIVTTPLAGFFKSLNEEKIDEDVVGMVGTMLSTIDKRRLGQAEIETGGAPHRVTVRSFEGMRIGKGTRVAFVRHEEEKNYYVVKPI